MTTKAISMLDCRLSGNARSKTKENGNDGFDSIFSLASGSEQSGHVALKQEAASKSNPFRQNNDNPAWDDSKKLFVPTDSISDPMDSTMTPYGDVNQYEEFIGNLLTDVMELEEEEWNQILEKLGINLLELFLNPDNLKPFILEANQVTDEVAFLTNESMLDQLNQLLTAFQDLELPEWNLQESELLDSGKGIFTPQDLDFQDLIQEDNTWSEGIGETVGMFDNEEGLPDEDLRNLEDALAKDAAGPVDDVIHEASTLREEGLEEPPELGMGGKEQNDPLKTQEAKTNESNQEGNEVTILVEKEEGTIGNDAEGKNQEEAKQSTKNESTIGQNVNRERPADTLDAFVQNLVGEAAKEDTLPTQQVTTMKEIVMQVVEQIKVMIKPDLTGMELSLHPEHLGKVNLSVVMKEGVATANFLVQNEMVKEALQSHMQALRENLEQQGLKVEAIEVNVSDFGSPQSDHSKEYQSQKSKEKKSHRSLKAVLDLDGVDVGMEDSSTLTESELNGSLVDYIA